jgi:hypothetical protein
VQLNNVFSKNEIYSNKGETIAKHFFEKNKIPYLYIGQGPIGVEKSLVLKNELKAHRPDFMINITNIGCIFFDIKYRELSGFNEKDKDCFLLYKEEAEGLLELQETLLMPVWICFLSSSIEYSKDNFPPFYLLSGSNLRKIIEKLKSDNKLYPKIAAFRIPLNFLQRCENKLEFTVGVNDILEKSLDNYKEKTEGIVRRIEDEIKAFIRKNKVLKSKLSTEMLKNLELKYFCKSTEINKILEILIDGNIVVFDHGKPLRLKGE